MNKQVRYVVVDEATNGDRCEKVCHTPEEANSEAEMQWGYLTRSEKKNRHIYACLVTEDDLDPDDVEDYGLDNDKTWCGHISSDGFPGAFDSDKEDN